MSAQTMSVTDIQIAEALRSIAGPVFAAVWSEHRQTHELTVHASAVRGQRDLKINIINTLSNIGIDRCKVHFHAVSSLLSPRSLEKLVSKFASGRIVYDPTSSLTRAYALVKASRDVRAALGTHVRGLYYAPRVRTFYVSLEPARVAAGEKVKVAELTRIEDAVLKAVGVAFAPQLGDCPAVRVGFGLPSAELVPVDQGSVMHWGRQTLRAALRYWKPLTVAALFGLGGAAAAKADDAVSEANLKLGGQFGNVIDDYTWQVQGQFTAPVGQDFGLQLEGGGGAVNGHDYYGVGGHLFTRDPDLYLLGLFGAYTEAADLNVKAARAGAEVEFYLSDLTILSTAGYQFSGTDALDGAFGSIDLRWYVTNNFTVQGGAFLEKDKAYGRVGLEWQPGFMALPGLAFNANGVWGDDDFHSVMGGLTYYFGTPVNLKDRHRKQDPESALFSLFQTVKQEQARICAAYGTC
ncbi:MAG: hypothetical protein ABL996_00470 [Micropepsaceae bacterium]